MSDKRLDVVVLGAGIVGVSAAYAARQQGFSVVLVDRREPGSETSYGNAGILSSGSISPLNNPSLWNSLPKYLSNRHAALRWNIGWTLRNPEWVIQFLANAIPSRTKPLCTAPAMLPALRTVLMASIWCLCPPSTVCPSASMPRAVPYSACSRSCTATAFPPKTAPT